MADGAQPSPEARPDKSREDTRRDRPVERLNGASFIHQVALAGVLVVLVTVASLLLEPFTGYLSIALLYLLLIVAAALKLGRAPVLILAAISALVWNFLFIPPHFTFYIDRLEDAMMFATFFVVAMAMGHLASRLRSSEMAERRRERRTAALYELAHQAAFATDLETGLGAAVSLIASVSGAQAALLLRRKDHTLSELAHPASSFTLSEREKTAALWAFDHPSQADGFIGARGDSSARCLPLQGRTAVMGVLCVRRAPGKSLDRGETELLEAFAVLIGLILEKDHVVEAVKRAEVLEASERLRRALLDSVSHELKTPLSAVQAGIDALGRQLGGDEEKRATLREVQSAVRRLRRVIDNLLTMTRIEAGVIQPKLDWCDVAELVQAAIDLAGDGVAEHEIAVEADHDLPMVRLDQALIEQCLYNLLLNAASWSRPGTTITVRAALDGDRLTLAILDEGPGVKETDLRRIFEKFYRASDAPPGGTGLGLAIVDNFVRSHGGSARAANRETGGAEFTLTIPVETMRAEALEELA